MLENLTPDADQLTVIRLSAVRDTAVLRLLNRSISPESIPEIQNGLQRQGFVFESAKLIDAVFERSTSPKHATPFRPSRFTNGQNAVFHSALEDQTSIEEIKYHQIRSGDFSDLKKSPTAPPRYFCLYEIDFDGTVLDLSIIHADCPELTSADESGYPRCRELAEEAQGRSINAFRTPSARRTGGTCTPVFDRQSLGDVPRLRRHGRFTNEHGQIVFTEL